MSKYYSSISKFFRNLLKNFLTKILKKIKEKILKIKEIHKLSTETL